MIETLINAINNLDESQLIGDDVITIVLKSSEDYNLLETYLGLTCFPKVYFRSREGKREYLGIGLNERFSFDQIDQKHKLPLFFNKAFDQKEDQTWQEISQDFIFNCPLTIIKKCNQISLIIKATSKKQLVKLLDNSNEDLNQEEDNQVLSILSTPSEQEWDKLISESTSQMDDKKLEKVVYARRYTEFYSKTLNVSNYVRQYIKRSGFHYIYFLQFAPKKTFLSLSPESLLKIEKDCLNVDVIAGTRSIGNNDIENLNLADELTHDPKEIYEHDIVSKQVKYVLEKHTRSYSLVFDKNILRQKYVQHLYSLYEGALKKDYSLKELIKDLHPTPAIGGNPKELALAEINKNEQFSRGLYAAPCGVITPDYRELLVGIRSVLIDDKQVHIFAGAGIVKESVSKNEWKETTKKMQNFLSQMH